MNRKQFAIAALGLNALLGLTGYGIGQTLNVRTAQPQTQTLGIASTTTQSIPYIDSGSSTLTIPNNMCFHSDGSIGSCVPPGPAGAVYHQVVDVYYDREGNKLDTKSATHAIGYDCHGGLRRQDQDLLVQDDGKGGVQFVQAFLGSEPREGVKPVTKDTIIKLTLALPHRDDPAVPVTPTQVTLAK